jgi:transposase
MHNPSVPENLLFVGIDVSARELVIAIEGDAGSRQRLRCPNTAQGHRQLLQVLFGKKNRQRARVCLEASGNYSLDLCLALDADTRVELSVVNPRQARNFALSLGKRSKNDPIDAEVLCQHARRMDAVVWSRPSVAALRLRAITRAMQSLTHMAVEEKNREHAIHAADALPRVVAQVLRRHQQQIERSRTRLQQEALALVRRDPQLLRRLQLLDSIPGIDVHSALLILAELVVLPATLDARQWVAHAGLDPSHFTSGSSVQKKPCISKLGNRRLRAALYMPALVAVRHDSHLAHFYVRLLGRGKAKLQALTAVMRKLLHAMYAMFQHDEIYNGAKLCPLPLLLTP